MISNIPSRNDRVSALKTRSFTSPVGKGVLELYAEDLNLGNAKVNLQLRFIPLKFALEPQSLKTYTENLIQHLPNELETFAALCLDDLFDTLVPSYLEIIATSKTGLNDVYRCTFHKSQEGFKLPEEFKPLFYKVTS